jgi:hypothetical protein
MVALLPYTTLSGKTMVAFVGFITRTTRQKITKKVHGKGYGARW